MPSAYQELERQKAIQSIKNGHPIFYGGNAGGKFMGKKREFVLQDSSKNLYEPIRQEVIDYFRKNNISWWRGRGPSGHVLSSQIACLNHLFRIRNDKDAVLGLLKNISADFVDVLHIDTDSFAPGFIQFEAVSDVDHLNEKPEGSLTRGANCTSVDALMHAIHIDGSKWLIPIEWKYTEFYNNINKAAEALKGVVRKTRYTDLIKKSRQLKFDDSKCYYYEPFYQLMRQTLWAEQMVHHKDKEKIKADHYLHIHVIPDENHDLLNKQYKCSGKDMETTWREHLRDQTKYLIVSPEHLIKGLNKKYDHLIDYLTFRY